MGWLCKLGFEIKQQSQERKLVRFNYFFSADSHRKIEPGNCKPKTSGHREIMRFYRITVQFVANNGKSDVIQCQ